MARAWMVRAGKGGFLAEEFARGYVAIGWNAIGDLSNLTTAAEIRAAYHRAFPDARPRAASNDVAMLHKFRSIIKRGDAVLTFDGARREYLVGKVTGDYTFQPGDTRHQGHLRTVEWTGRVARSRLNVSSRNTLGSMMTIFSISEEVWLDISNALRDPQAASEIPPVPVEDEREELEETREDTESRALELIKDRLLRLDDSQMEHLVAAVLRAMGYRTRVSPKGPDRGVDVFASPDGFGFQEPRIKVEVKHRPNSTIGAPEIRSFLGALRPGDRGLYVSTGGFSKEANYEAERANVPVMLLDLDELAESVVRYYESFDLEGRALISLVKVYWPTE